MKHLFSILLCLSFFSFAHATSQEDVKQKTAEAADTAANYTKEQKEKFQKDVEANLQKIKQETADLKTQASQKTGDAQKKVKEQIAVLEKKQVEAQKELDQLSKKTGKAWTDMKQGMSAAMDKLSESYQKAKADMTESR